MSSAVRSTSVSPSPDGEDISKAGVWTEETLSAGSSSGSGSVRRSKGKESDQETLQEETTVLKEDGDGYGAVEGYPPTKEEEAESRRIEENLSRWEMAERERRKAARESSSLTSGSTLVGEISRRASLLWPSGRAKHASSGGVGMHRALRTTEDGVPLDEIEGSPSPRFGENPFSTPNISADSLHDPYQSVIMRESTSENPFEDAEQASTARPTDDAPASFPKQPPPPPQPLSLPKPRSPPPRAETPHADRPPEPIPPPQVAPSPEQEEEPQEVRWWTEWLCGCTEGPDRGGDHQAGRTNPFE
ncbi:uncharacterized protein LAESUDRAFT_809815 [Laetiporus sulphureus 93-53]|uniref:Uncharacterized protein n=1 Tax=Laetiporus sulphureus 93-53 TaxID=1314785 RepID=A0A165GXL5_9APHY|nr:uncharacterized protein LAESUDRAFT_809815 [Laetiporus sulphureus 93-53]KZT10966.1 hypothetical protein LAESUDRAFT_809815 [Laetiporus sulphureus 93-53]